MVISKPPRVCLLLNSYYPIVGGGETHARMLAARLVKRQCAVTVITRRRPSDSPKRETFEGSDIHRIRPRGLDRLGKYLMMPGAFVKLIILRKQYDVIYVCGLRTLGVVGVVAGKILRKPCILRIESCTEMSGEYATGGYLSSDSIHKRSFSNKLIGIAIKLRNKLMCQADSFLAISRVIHDEFVSCGVSPNRIADIHNGIDTDKFKPVDENVRIALRRKLNLPDKAIFIYTGKLNRGKGLEMLLSAWKSISAAHPNAHLLLVGGGANQFLSCEEKLRKFTLENKLENSVTFTGNVSNVEEYLQASNFFVFPSETEALGLSLIEAMACELPSIACATGGILDIIEDNDNGLLIPVGDQNALERAICKLLNEPEMAEKFRINGRLTVENKFCIQAIADKHIELFHKLKKSDAR